MQADLYVGLSGQLALKRRLDTIANNIANLSTPGYRAEEVSFTSLISGAADQPVNFASKGEDYISTRSGELVQTGNPLDIAVSGDAWLSIATPRGNVLTRDGRMRMTPDGQLETMSGYKVLDVGGAPVQLDTAAGPPTIARDGTITQNGRQIGAIGLFQIDPAAKLTRYENSGVIPDRPPIPQIDFNRAGVAQGYIERANVNPVMEMTRLIALQRSFDAITNTMNDIESSFNEAIRNLGGS